MSAPSFGDLELPSPLDEYRDEVTQTEGIDEVVTLDGVREAAEPLAGAIDAGGLTGMLAARAASRRFVEDEGITYGAGILSEGSDPPEGRAVPTEPRTWELDPLPLTLGATEWGRLEQGVRQRAALMDGILTDLTGEQRLVRAGILPGSAVYGHEGWLPQADGIRLPGPRQLVMPAMDLARDGTGTWRVFADRTQAPSGAGYALANRRITARVLPDLHRQVDLARLRAFFYQVHKALMATAPPTDDVPRIVILTPGALSDAAYDEALQSTVLGVPVVEADDLVSRDGRIWMRTTSGLSPVDVIMRRVDGGAIDQLDLRGDSRLGLPGMVEAARLGHVSLVNPISSGVLENPALIPYLPAICRYLLDEDLTLQSTTTWWAGEPTHLSHIMANLSSLVVKPASRGDGTNGGNAVFGWEITADEREDLARRIQAEPWKWTAQDPLTMSSAPVVTAGGLEPRHVVLRTFAVADEDDYAVLPGGLGRVAVRPDSGAISSLTGAMSKDVWVRDDSLADDEGEGLAVPSPFAGAAALASAAPPPRVAADLYWMGRYAERAEFGARLLRVADNLVDDHAARPGTTGHTAMLAVLEAVTAVVAPRPALVGEDARERRDDPLPHLRALTLDPRVVGSVAYSTHHAVIAAQAVRETLSVDTWLVMSRLERTLRHAVPDDDLQELLMETIEGLLALAGIGVESLTRDPTWAFADAGKRVERAQQTIRLVTSVLAVERAPVVEGTTTEAALLAAESVITYRRRLTSGLGGLSPLQAAVDLLLRDGSNPRSVGFQVSRLVEDLELLEDERVLPWVRELAERIDGLDLDELFADGRMPLSRSLTGLGADLRQVHRTLDETYFQRKAAGRAIQWTQWSSGEGSW
ncbi:circularly permuted type 2 ATP-grasp protein [Janibacter cremeus]|uniref:Putative circularly permuted ATP-grasp superfamily protein/putative alpha-E superfamily protein n=1 Tax=Janibacter cremeus TaxID=1285192 RepID=A0A852VMD7_9MICO|nr:circularly permuted type 2 ATP-grasp protein [Janibacter cremeus]NYF98192.1 putative circularly permuted ATP-grasp superfamily protein/putative alpha-E superfamily protein [Janibacter cremeus]